MGLYDELGGVQIKCGACIMEFSDVGDRVDFSDGIYVGYEGAAVVKDNVLVAVFPELTDKWGCPISVETVLEGRNPILNAAKKQIDKYVNTDEDRGINVGP